VLEKTVKLANFITSRLLNQGYSVRLWWNG
jgi:hypothetical protein